MGVVDEKRLDRLGGDQQDAGGLFKQASFWRTPDTSPCHLCTGISASWHNSSSRENWSLINALSGPT